MEDKELEEFKHWNPMKSDYENPEYNQYNNGPGSCLPIDQQVPQRINKSITTSNVNAKGPYLVFFNVPQNMTRNGLFNLCSKYGQVTDVRLHKLKPIYFVDVMTVV